MLNSKVVSGIHRHIHISIKPECQIHVIEELSAIRAIPCTPIRSFSPVEFVFESKNRAGTPQSPGSVGSWPVPPISNRVVQLKGERWADMNTLPMTVTSALALPVIGPENTAVFINSHIVPKSINSNFGLLPASIRPLKFSSEYCKVGTSVQEA